MRFFSTPRATAAVLLFVVTGVAAHAQDDGNAQNNAPVFRDAETESVFGFTEGSGIGLQGEKEFTISTTANSGKRGGRYFGSETKLEYEFTPNQYVEFELGPLVSYHDIDNVSGFENRNELGIGGFFGEVNYLLLDRTSSSPLAITLSAEPEWKRISGNSGNHENAYELELKVKADLELIKNRLYLGSNLLYEPEATHDPDGIGAGWEMESTGGVSVALSYRITPPVFISGEVWYLRHYAGAWFNEFEGNAVFVGPAVFVKLRPHVHLMAAWNVQVWGQEEDDPNAHLNLHEFSQNRFKLKWAMEF